MDWIQDPVTDQAVLSDYSASVSTGAERSAWVIPLPAIFFANKVHFTVTLRTTVKNKNSGGKKGREEGKKGSDSFLSEMLTFHTGTIFQHTSAMVFFLCHSISVFAKCYKKMLCYTNGHWHCCGCFTGRQTQLRTNKDEESPIDQLQVSYLK